MTFQSYEEAMAAMRREFPDLTRMFDAIDNADAAFGRAIQACNPDPLPLDTDNDPPTVAAREVPRFSVSSDPSLSSRDNANTPRREVSSSEDAK